MCLGGPHTSGQAGGQQPAWRLQPGLPELPHGAIALAMWRTRGGMSVGKSRRRNDRSCQELMPLSTEVTVCWRPGWADPAAPEALVRESWFRPPAITLGRGCAHSPLCLQAGKCLLPFSVVTMTPGTSGPGMWGRRGPPARSHVLSHPLLLAYGEVSSAGHD